MKVILVVGPSGSGKDTLLRNARGHFCKTRDLGFIRRYITRPPDRNEDNFYIDPKGFLTLKECRFFLSTWQAHGNYYGISNHSMKSGNNYIPLLCSISRDAIVDFEKEFPNTTTIHITAAKDILRQRLQKRGRENPEEIENRLKRATRPVVARNLITFDNSTQLGESITNFISLLSELG